MRFCPPGICPVPCIVLSPAGRSLSGGPSGCLSPAQCVGARWCVGWGASSSGAPAATCNLLLPVPGPAHTSSLNRTRTCGDVPGSAPCHPCARPRPEVEPWQLPRPPWVGTMVNRPPGAEGSGQAGQPTPPLRGGPCVSSGRPVTSLPRRGVCAGLRSQLA